mgnify:CR=1 FL=1
MFKHLKTNNYIMITDEENLVINNEDKSKNSCKEYQALKYKTMITTGTNIEKKIENETNEEQLNKFLENEILINKSQNWNKLSKTEKTNKIKFYVNNKAKDDYNLNEDETLAAKKYILHLLNRNQINKNNEINYNKESGNIENFNVILFNENTRKFTLNKTFNPQSKKKRVPLKADNKKKTSKNVVNKKKENES